MIGTDVHADVLPMKHAKWQSKSGPRVRKAELAFEMPLVMMASVEGQTLLKERHPPYRGGFVSLPRVAIALGIVQVCNLSLSRALSSGECQISSDKIDTRHGWNIVYLLCYKGVLLILPHDVGVDKEPNLKRQESVHNGRSRLSPSILSR